MKPTSAAPIRQRAHTKIVATVGPACREPAKLAALAQAGVDVFRLNMAHGSLAERSEDVANIRQVSEQLGLPLAILIDLGGPKIRLGELPNGEVKLEAGTEVRFVPGETSTNPDELVTNYEPLIAELKAGDRVLLVDGTVRLDVIGTAATYVSCRVVQPGLIRSRQGVNLPGAKLSLPAMTPDDHEHARWAAEQDVDFVGLSFVRTARDVVELKAILSHYGSSAHVIAKIEKPEALEELERIIDVANGVMVARGDLGVEIDVARMPIVQKEIVAACNARNKPVIVATQMLESMQHSRQPTRAEVTDVANAILDGCDACMLSGETAMGEYPQAAVEMMHRIALETEPLLDSRLEVSSPAVSASNVYPITRGIVAGADRIAREIDVQLLVVVSHSGKSATAISKRRYGAPIIGVSDNPRSLRRMCLAWGVVPMIGAPTTDSRALLNHIENWGLAEGCISPGGFVLLVSGTGLMSQGHNMLRVYEVGTRP